MFFFVVDFKYLCFVICFVDKSSDPKRSTKINLDDDNTYAKIRKSKSESQDETEKKNSEKTEL